MEYVVLARRFRPQCFREIVGQEAIVATLKNALRFNRAAHAYLFSGARGVGKTTLARIFAKALKEITPYLLHNFTVQSDDIADDLRASKLLQ